MHEYIIENATYKMQYTAHIYYGIVIVKVKIALSIIMES